MVYNITTEDLRNYLEERLRSYRLNVSKSGRGVSIKVVREGKSQYAFINPVFEAGELDRIVLEVEANGKSTEDFNRFLTEAVDGDKIFSKPNVLYSPERQRELKKYRGFLRRVPTEGKMACEIIDRNLSTELLRKGFYDYMIRPVLFYMFN